MVQEIDEKKLTEYKAILVHKIFENVNNGYGVATFNDCAIKKGKKKKITCNGYFLPDSKDLTYIIKGEWKTHPKYGEQFSIYSFDEYIEKTSDGIITYLSAGIIKGIGKVTAQRIYDEFGENSLEVIENTPEQLLCVKGITKTKLKKIEDSYKESRQSRELFKMLLPYGFTSNIISAIFSRFKFESISKIKENPYIMCEVRNISFERVDAYAKKINYSMQSKERFVAAVKAVIKEEEQSGNLGIELGKFGNEILKKVGEENYSKEKINENTIELIKTGFLKFQKMDYGEGVRQFLYLKEMAKMESDTAEDICRIAIQKENTIRNIEEKICKLSKEFGIELDKEQLYAVLTALSFPMSVISGPPGTGKTTIIKIIATLYERENEDKELVFLAPTGKAARKIKESTGYSATTIHKKLELCEENIRIEDIVSIENSLVIVDEFSMADAYIARKLMHAIKNGCKLIIVGDIDQLPSVGPGAVLRDIIESGICPVVFLNKIYRQEEDTQIYLNASKIKKGETDIKEGKDFKIHEMGSNLMKIEDAVVEKVIERINQYGLEQVLCLCPYKDHTAGVYSINRRIQARINPKNAKKKEIVFKDTLFREGDLVMHIEKNVGEITNGETGFIKEIRTDSGSPTIIVNMSGVMVEYKGDDMVYLTLAYASTIHKAQGSDAKAVISLLTGTAYDRPMLVRNLPYTAITRAKEMYDFYGSYNALIRAIQNVDTSKRITLLGYYLKILAGKFVHVN